MRVSMLTIVRMENLWRNCIRFMCVSFYVYASVEWCKVFQWSVITCCVNVCMSFSGKTFFKLINSFSWLVPHLYQFLTVCVHVNCWVRAILGMQVTLRHTILSVRVGTNDELIICYVKGSAWVRKLLNLIYFNIYLLKRINVAWNEDNSVGD